MQSEILTRSSEDSKVTKFSFDPLSKEVVDCAFKIHQAMGSGLLESIYEDCFVLELQKRNIAFERQKAVSVFYEGQRLPSCLKLDLVINNELIVELKSQAKLLDVHTAQIITYLKTSGYKTGLLINFGEPYFKKAIKRFVL